MLFIIFYIILYNCTHNYCAQAIGIYVLYIKCAKKAFSTCDQTTRTRISSYDNFFFYFRSKTSSLMVNTHSNHISYNNNISIEALTSIRFYTDIIYLPIVI
jgi:hypothetical protein